MKNNTNIVFLGGGGHSLSCCDILHQDKVFNLIGFIDTNKNALLKENGYKWLGSNDTLEDVIKKYKNIFICIGYIKKPNKRIYFYEESKKFGGLFPILKSKFAYVSQTAFVEEGSLIMNGVNINAKVHIGKNCIINTNAVIEHGANVGNHVHIAPSATILGDVNIGDECFIGAGAIIREGISIGKGIIIKAGELVIKNRSK